MEKLRPLFMDGGISVNRFPLEIYDKYDGFNISRASVTCDVMVVAQYERGAGNIMCDFSLNMSICSHNANVHREVREKKESTVIRYFKTNYAQYCTQGGYMVQWRTQEGYTQADQIVLFFKGKYSFRPRKIENSFFCLKMVKSTLFTSNSKYVYNFLKILHYWPNVFFGID